MKCLCNLELCLGLASRSWLFFSHFVLHSYSSLFVWYEKPICCYVKLQLWWHALLRVYLVLRVAASFDVCHLSGHSHNYTPLSQSRTTRDAVAQTALLMTSFSCSFVTVERNPGCDGSGSSLYDVIFPFLRHSREKPEMRWFKQLTTTWIVWQTQRTNCWPRDRYSCQLRGTIANSSYRQLK